MRGSFTKLESGHQKKLFSPTANPPARGPMPRTLAIDENLITRVCEVIKEGRTPSEAFNAVGVPPSTRTRWVRRGRGYEGPKHPLLTEMVRRVDEAWMTSIDVRVESYNHRKIQVGREQYRRLREENTKLHTENSILKYQLQQAPRANPAAERKFITVNRRRYPRW